MIKLVFLKTEDPKLPAGVVECSSWDNIVVCYSRRDTCRCLSSQLNIILNIPAFQDKIPDPKICLYISSLTEKIFFLMMCMVFKNWVLLCWHSWLLYNCNSKWSSDSVMTILLLFFCCTHSTIIIILSHSCCCPCLYEVFFFNYPFCNKLGSMLLIQAAQIYFSANH